MQKELEKRTKTKCLSLVAGIGVFVASTLNSGCSQREEAIHLPAKFSSETWKLSDGVEYPAGRLLSRAEDGIMLSSGSLLVADQRYGLVKIDAKGRVDAFGGFDDVNYRHEPPLVEGGPNGVNYTFDRNGVLTADVYSGHIYHTSIAQARTEIVYSHEYGVNTAKEDSTGAIWFTQSTQNIGEERLFDAIATPIPDGAVFRLPPPSVGLDRPAPAMVIEGLNFANGFFIDEDRGKFYLSETLSNRVLVFDLDVSLGTLSKQEILASIPSPDNMDMNHDGTLWVASPLANQIHRVDLETGEVDIVFDAQTEQGAGFVEEGILRVQSGKGIADLIGPETTGEMPGLLTGMILGNESGPFYVANLGAALIQVSPKDVE